MNLLFLGDSLIEFYDWQARFPASTVVNSGRGGETVTGLLANLPGHLRRCPDPERAVLMIGTNNLLREDDAFLPDYTRILDALSSVLPPAQIIVTSLPPLRAAHLAPSVVPRVNQGLRQLSQQKKAGFLDLFSAFTADAPCVAACFTDDGVHLSDLGYTIWSARLARML